MTTSTETERGNLILKRREGEVIWIGDVRLTIDKIDGNRVSVAIYASRDVKILRGELVPIEEADAIAMLESAQTGEGWNGFVDRIRKSHNSDYPDWWKRAVIDSGVMAEAYKRLANADRQEAS